MSVLSFFAKIATLDLPLAYLVVVVFRVMSILIVFGMSYLVVLRGSFIKSMLIVFGAFILSYVSNIFLFLLEVGFDIYYWFVWKIVLERDLTLTGVFTDLFVSYYFYIRLLLLLL
jgi:hypothetical protein